MFEIPEILQKIETESKRIAGVRQSTEEGVPLSIRNMILSVFNKDLS